MLATNIGLRASHVSRSHFHTRSARHQARPVFLSVLSYWEVVVKGMKGNQEVGDPRLWWPKAVDQLAAVILPLRPDHVGEIADLPPLHSDPFDRGLIAQARAEELVLVTNDAHIAKYAGGRLRILD